MVGVCELIALLSGCLDQLKFPELCHTDTDKPSLYIVSTSSRLQVCCAGKHQETLAMVICCAVLFFTARCAVKENKLADAIASDCSVMLAPSQHYHQSLQRLRQTFNLAACGKGT